MDKKNRFEIAKLEERIAPSPAAVLAAVADGQCNGTPPGQGTPPGNITDVGGGIINAGGRANGHSPVSGLNCDC